MKEKMNVIFPCTFFHVQYKDTNSFTLSDTSYLPHSCSQEYSECPFQLQTHNSAISNARSYHLTPWECLSLPTGPARAQEETEF